MFYFFLEIKNSIKQFEINLNFFIFKDRKESLMFTLLNNRERDLEKSGLDLLYSNLVNVYNKKLEYAVSTTLKHTIVFEKIEQISIRNVYIPDKNERAKEKKNDRIFGFFQNNFQRDIQRPEENLNDNHKKEEYPFVMIDSLLIELNKNYLNENFERKELENILEDLHKLGLIVYFKKKSLSDIIISYPHWFNNVFKSILDFGRKKISLLLESIHQLIQTTNRKMKEELKKTILWLKGNSNQKYFSDIWKNKKELEKSNLDKICFKILLVKLEESIGKLIEQKEFSIFKKIEEFQDPSISSISQKFIFINEEDLVYNIFNDLLEIYIIKADIFFKAKKEFLMNILSQFDFIIPTKRLLYKLNGKLVRNERTYIVPLLFAYNPSSFKSLLFIRKNEENWNKINFDNSPSTDIQITKKNEDWNNFEFKFEWIVDYLLPFKPSAVWKLLFMRIRRCCVGESESQREMVEDIYWLNGFTFKLTENDSAKIKTLIELEFVEDNKISGQVLMNISIKSNLMDIDLFYSSLHQVIQMFIKEWIVPEIYERIKIQISRIVQSKLVSSIQKHFKIAESFQLNDQIGQYLSNTENNKNQEKFKCFHCGFLISIEDIKKDLCGSCKIFYLHFIFFIFYFLFHFNFKKRFFK